MTDYLKTGFNPDLNVDSFLARLAAAKILTVENGYDNADEILASKDTQNKKRRTEAELD